ncbi:hypothetical protein KIM372_04120 [Bombiscardovia nodaiensis]|uniref:Major facilitator superfamily (MFS) profile domain-containing protein n=1 Tax=Bombiscardovia nodaiensis TaxID=2932181 RepID=A0ABM8B744_9BIFI|nr:hypothetical protein KIM372_04120 [Bombiscardovia nodaiensis]
MSTPKQEPVSLWKMRTYRLWFTADTSDVMAVSLRTFAVPLIAFALTGSESTAGVVVAIESTLVLVALPAGGTLIDRYDRRKLMILLGLAGALLSLIAVGLMQAHQLTIGLLAAVVVAFGLLKGLIGGSNDAILKSLIPTSQFAKAQAVREGREACISLCGSAIGSVLYKLASSVPFLASGLLYLLEAGSAFLLPGSPNRQLASKGEKPPEHTSAAPSAFRAFARELGEGVRWALTKRRFVLITVIGALLNIAFALVETGTQLTLIGRKTDPLLIGLLDTGMGATALLGSLLAGWLLTHIPTGRLLAYTSFAVCASYLPLLALSSYWAMLICLSLTGLLLPGLNAGLCGFIFGKTPDSMQGRANAVFETALGLPAAITPALTGFALQLPHGFTLVVALAVALTIAATALSALTSVRTIPKPQSWEEASL